jgi:hypothetical protein
MKNQYFGDVNDFRKYGLLRTLQRVAGLAVGVCWFLTVDDGAGDGELRNYLNRPGRWRHYDPELYDKLQRLLGSETQRSVSRASEWELIPGAFYFDAVLRDHRLARAGYFEAARHLFRNSDLVFVDPDNGIEVPSTKLGASGSSKYVYWTELQAMYADGQSILVYQHFPRVVRERFVPFIAGRLSEELHSSTVVAFSTAHVVFFLVQQPKHAAALAKAVREVERQWLGQIEVWPLRSAGQPNPWVDKDAADRASHPQR